MDAGGGEAVALMLTSMCSPFPGMGFLLEIEIVPLVILEKVNLGA